MKAQPRTRHTREPDPTHLELKHIIFNLNRQGHTYKIPGHALTGQTKPGDLGPSAYPTFLYETTAPP